MAGLSCGMLVGWAGAFPLFTLGWALRVGFTGWGLIFFLIGFPMAMILGSLAGGVGGLAGGVIRSRAGRKSAALLGGLVGLAAGFLGVELLALGWAGDRDWEFTAVVGVSGLLGGYCGGLARGDQAEP